MKKGPSRVDGRGELVRADSALPALNQEGESLGAERFVSRFAYVLGLVALRQRFVRRSQGAVATAVKGHPLARSIAAKRLRWRRSRSRTRSSGSSSSVSRRSRRSSISAG